MNSPSIIWRNHKKLSKYLNKVGKLLVWTTVTIPPLGFEDFAPIICGIVEFDSGEKLPLQIVDCEEKDLRLDQKVITVIRRGKKGAKDEVIEYVVKAKPLL